MLKGVSAGTEGAKEAVDRSSELRGDGALLPLLAEVGLTKRDLCREGEADLDKRPRVLEGVIWSSLAVRCSEGAHMSATLRRTEPRFCRASGATGNRMFSVDPVLDGIKEGARSAGSTIFTWLWGPWGKPPELLLAMLVCEAIECKRWRCGKWVLVGGVDEELWAVDGRAKWVDPTEPTLFRLWSSGLESFGMRR